MPFQIGNGSLPAAISNSHINEIARSDTPPEISVWEKIKAFFCSTNKPETLEFIRQICHPPAGTTREDVAGRFEQLRTLAYAGFEESVQSGRHGENHFCILDENNREILSVTLDDAGEYTVTCQGHRETHHLIPEPGEGCAEHTEDASGTLRAEHAATTAPQTAPDYEAVWSAWEKAAPAGESPHRAEAVRKMRDCLHNGNPELDLGDVKITSLPDHLPPDITALKLFRVPLACPLTKLPQGLQTLDISRSRLTSLPEPLPPGLLTLDISHNKLTSLPESLPPGLRTLDISHNQLTSLPEPLPPGLRTLDISANQLTSLPEPLPPGLLTLDITDNELTSLPEPLPPGLLRLKICHNQLTSLPESLPPGLRTLNAYANQLTSLPESLPPGLLTLNAYMNQLTSLPESLPPGLLTLNAYTNQLTSLPESLPPGLRTLDISDNQLTSLPESIADLFSDTIVSLENNPLSERTRRNLEAVTRAPYYSGPTIHFSMDSSSTPREARPLHLAVADWLTPAKEGEPTPAGSWQSFGQENDAASFSAFLDRLSETENFRKDPGFKAQVATWLTQLTRDDELRAKTFNMATEATSSCEDRVTLALNQMKNVQLVHDAEKGKYDNNLPGLVSAGREMFRLEKLEQIARDKISTLRFVDEIEVYLAYQNKLKEALELSSVSAEMRFFGVSGVTDSDLQAAELQVKTAEDSQFSEWILQWSPLCSMLERAYPEDWEKLTEKKISDYDDAYRMLSDSELKPAGLVGNADAERAVGARALERAEQAFLDGLRPLADRMPGGHLKARWS